MTATNMTIIRCHVYWKFVLVTPTTQWVFFTDRHSRFLPQSRTENLRGFRFQLRWCCMRCIREETCNEHDMCNEHDIMCNEHDSNDSSSVDFLIPTNMTSYATFVGFFDSEFYITDKHARFILQSRNMFNQNVRCPFSMLLLGTCHGLAKFVARILVVLF